MSENNNSNGSLGLCSIVFIVFLILKLTGVISWSWWWVTTPLWGPIALIVGVLAILGIVKTIIQTRK